MSVATDTPLVPYPLRVAVLTLLRSVAKRGLHFAVGTFGCSAAAAMKWAMASVAASARREIAGFEGQDGAGVVLPRAAKVLFFCSAYEAEADCVRIQSLSLREDAIMTPEQVEQRIIALIYREPFVPVVAEMADGQSLEIPHPRPAINGGGAVFF